MKPSELERARSLYLKASGLAPAERVDFLSEACGGDYKCQTLVREMLAEHADSPGRFDDSPARPWINPPWRESFPDHEAGRSLQEQVPERVGRYRIIGKIGEGGMGDVFEAEQDHPRRVVALKFLRTTIVDREMIQRFRREIELLGQLHHPGIAQIYDAGTAAVGMSVQPYFAMELVRGVPLNDFAATNKLSTRRRLELVVRLCAAVQHAHEHGIVHRDLKPANILVDNSIDGGQPKILDFGVARALDSDVRVTTMQTDVGQLVGTLQYMSPEQATGDPSYIDLRSDVYSLGVILYELLSGEAPYECGRRSVPEAVRVILEVEPRRLGTLCMAYRGDLESIVTKSLQKEPRHRYQSACELVEDLRRYLADEPIRARPTSRLYQLKKFALRHRGLVAGITLTLVALLTGTIVSTGLYLSVRAERERALAALEESEAVMTFITDYIASPRAQGDGLRVRELFDRAAASLGDRFANRPSIEARICDILGEAYRNLGDLEAAGRFLPRAFDIRRRELGPRHAATAMSLQHCAMLASDLGKLEEAERLAGDAIEIQTELFGLDHDPTLRTREVLGDVIRKEGRLEECLEILRRVHQTRLRVNGPTDSRTLRAAGRLATVLPTLEAERIYKSIIERTPPLSVLETSRARINLGMIYRGRGNLEGAARMFDENEALMKRCFHDDHPLRLKNSTEIGILRFMQNRYDDADEILRNVLDRSTLNLGEKHTHTLWTAFSLVDNRIKTGDYDGALPIAQRAVRATEGRSPGFLQLLARIERGLGHSAEATALEEAAARLPISGMHPWQQFEPSAGRDTE